MTAQDRKRRRACQPRTNANMLIGRDAGSTRITAISALLSDEAPLRSDAKMEKAKQVAAEPVGLRLVNQAYHCFSTA
jgi:hypothetical protein